MTDLLIQAMSAKQQGDLGLAKQLLSQAIVQDPNNEAAWMLMAEVVDDVKLRRNCLERVLAINPDNEAASMALTKLNTSPLEPIVRGEREKPIDTPNIEKIPPFTPPFTWSGDPEQFLALGDLTFPDIPPEEEQTIPETTPTFDWANESEEPDETIDKIFNAVSKPELASEPPPSTKEKDWLEDLRPKDENESTSEEQQDVEDPWLKELVGSEVAEEAERSEGAEGSVAQEAQVPLTTSPTDFSVSSEPEWGMAAFTPTDQPPPSDEEQDSLLWDNPRAKNDRLIILSHRSLIFANPPEANIPQILSLFNENKMVRDLLGDEARMIRLDSIERVSADPNTSNLIIDFNLDEKDLSHEFIFSSPQVRDEAMTALRFRLGAGFNQSHRSISLEDKIMSPLAILFLVVILTVALLVGVPMLSTLPGFEGGPLEAITASVQGMIDTIRPITIILIAVLIGAACIYWLIRNLRKPSDLLILKR